MNVLEAAERVKLRAGGIRYFDHKKEEERIRRHPLLAAAREVRMHATEYDEAYPGLLTGLPLDGLTRDLARTIRFTLEGYPVRFWSVNDELYDHGIEGMLGVFNWIRLEGEYGFNVLSAPYDVEFATDWSELPSGPRIGCGVSRVLGPGALARLDVLSMNPFRRCERCFCWRPMNALADSDLWMLNDKFLDKEYTPRMECKNVSEEGYCQ